jgi:hypothetical protein
MAVNYVKHEKIDMKNHPELNEEWIMDIIREEPSVLDLGDLRASGSYPPTEITLQGYDNDIFKVRIQLGETDESLIAKTIGSLSKGWGENYKYYAVIIAENITDSFFDAISLFEGLVPLIVIQANAVKIGDNISLVFTKVVDWKDKEPRQTAVTTSEISKLTKIILTGLFQDYVKIALEKVNKLKFDKNDDLSRAQLFAYHDIISDLRDEFRMISYKASGVRDFRARVDEIIKDEFNVVKKVINTLDPLRVMMYNPGDDEYEYEIREIVLRLRQKSSVKEIADIVSYVFRKWGLDCVGEWSAENYTHVAKKIKEDLDEMKKEANKI